MWNKTIKDIENKEQKNLFCGALDANEVIKMNDKVTIKDWTIDAEFANGNAIVPSETKQYIDDMLEPTIQKKWKNENENVNEKISVPEPVALNHILTKDSMAPNVT